MGIGKLGQLGKGLGRLGPLQGASSPQPSPLQMVTLSKSYTFEGDSIIAGNLPGVPNRIQDFAATYLTGTILNRGVGGTTTAQIAASTAAETTQQKAGYGIVGTSRNDTSSLVGTTGIVSGAMTQYAIIAGIVSPEWAFMGPPLADIEPYGDPAAAQCASISRKMAAAYPGRFIDINYILRQHPDGSANDAADIAAGYTPRSTRLQPNSSINSLHPGAIGNKYIADEGVTSWAQACEGALAFANPYTEWRLSGVAAATAQTNGGAVMQAPIKGTPDACAIVGGDTANFQISNSGAITRKTGAVITAPFSLIRFSATKNGLRTIGLIKLFIGAADTSCSDVTFDGKAFMMMPDSMSGVNASKASFFVALAPTADGTSRFVLGSDDTAHSISVEVTTGNRVRVLGKNAAGSVVLNCQTAAVDAILSGTGVVWVFFSTDMSGAGGTANTQMYVNETASKSFVSAIGGETLVFNNRAVIGAQAQLNQNPYKGGLRVFGMFNDFIDWSNSARRAEVYDSATRAAKLLPSNGAVNGIAPLVWLPGNAADRAWGYNGGTGGDFVTALLPSTTFG